MRYDYTPIRKTKKIKIKIWQYLCQQYVGQKELPFSGDRM